ncbi:LysR family transcriptional regulator [Streptomyces sp. NBC_01497]|uniref:LysR family transcriptional regulator n=1 Tax=Streptomyces sp. NBC_01497 TaxID=2903885 RepID=UPI002E34D254|nr:LysR family transcriptional regulator [Streptomyces sp. NBC_01497]
MLDVRRLQVFLAVAEEGSVTAAAQRLYLTQSAVSQQVQALERELDVPLLRRVARGVRLTPAGAALAAHAKDLFGRLTTVEEEIRSFADGSREVRLGAFASAGVELLPLALRTFRARRPDVRVLLNSVHADDPPVGLREGRFHALLTWEYDFAPQPADPGLAPWHLADDPLRAVVPADHPLAGRHEVALSELAAERWVVRAHRAPYADAYETMCRIAGFEPAVAFTTDDYQSLQGLVAAGMGVSLAPALSLFPHREDIAVLRVAAPAPARRVSALTLTAPGPGTPLRDLLDILADTARDLLTGH